MNIQSNIPLPITPQAWIGKQLIYYYNHVDNGEQEEGNEGQRYCADFVIIESTNQAAIDSAIRIATEHPEKLRSIVDGTEDVWDYPERKIRVDISNDDLLKIIGNNPSLIDYQNSLSSYIVSRNGFRLIYLEQLNDEERFLFNQKELYPSVIIHE